MFSGSIDERSTFSLTERVYREDSGLFSPVSFFGLIQYTHDVAVKFCKLKNGALVKVDDEVKFNQVLEFAESFFTNLTSEFDKARFWLVALENVSSASVSGKYMQKRNETFIIFICLLFCNIIE